MKGTKKRSAERIIAIVLFISLIVSLIYSIVRFILAPGEPVIGGEYEKIKSDYLLMITQCMLGIAVMLLPTLFTHKLKIMLPSVMCILYYIFLYCAIFLGEVTNFYYTVPHWDTMLHAMSGAMLGAVGFLVVDWLNKDNNVKVQLSPIFLSVFAFTFAIAVGVLWEIYEFSFDTVLGLNMQKHTTETGEALVGNKALQDTMKDIIIDALSALLVAVIGFVSNIKRKQKNGFNEGEFEAHAKDTENGQTVEAEGEECNA